MTSEIGRVIGTEKRPNTAYTFHFWTKVDAEIGIGSLVKVETEVATKTGELVCVYGVVVEAEGFNDLESPLHEFLAVDGDATMEPPTERIEMRVYQANVLRRMPEEPIGAVPIGRVFLASESDIAMALNTDKYKDEFGIPCGVYGDQEAPVPVHLDHRFLLGPESGHLNVTGTSGLASKTSYILWLLQSIFQTQGNLEDQGHKGVAVVLFNTKGGDLMYLDEPGTEEMTGLDLAIYQATGIQPQPFPKVRYFAPYDKNRVELATVRRNEELDAKNRVRELSFGLTDVLLHMEVLLNRDDLDAKADGYLQDLAQKVAKKTALVDGEVVKTLNQLIEFVEIQQANARENNQTVVEGHSIYTVGKMLNRLKGLGHRFPGLISYDGETCGPHREVFEPGSISVIDVSQLRSDAQDLVFSAVITRLRERMEESDLGVARLVVMIDEMNKYAPSGAGDTYVTKALRDISARGRYMGMTLFGAQQFRSRVDKEIVGNAATHVFGHIEAEELAQPGYSYFSPSVKEKLATLPQGTVLVKHPYFAQPVFVRFPRPATLKGQDGMRRYPQRPESTPMQAILAVLAGFPSYVAEARGLVGDLTNDDEELRRILYKLHRLKPGDNPIPILRGGEKKAQVKVARSQQVELGEDPFDF